MLLDLYKWPPVVGTRQMRSRRFMGSCGLAVKREAAWRAKETEQVS